MAREWTDADFEVVAGPLRHGDPHPTKTGWRYAGPDINGRGLWRRPPKLNRWQFFLMLCVIAVVLRLAVYFAAEAIHH